MATIPAEMTAVAGSVLTAAQWNGNVRDGINFLLSPPLFVARQATLQAIATATWTGLAWDATDIDRDAGHSNVTNNSRYTAQTAGWYQLDTNNDFGVSAAGQIRGIGWRVNGTGNAVPTAGMVQVPPTGSFDVALHTGGALFLNAGDWVETVVFHNAGASLTNGNNGGNPRVSIKWIST